MIRLNLPPFEMKISGTKQQPKILDILRRKYIALTPEEGTTGKGKGSSGPK